MYYVRPTMPRQALWTPSRGSPDHLSHIILNFREQVCKQLTVLSTPAQGQQRGPGVQPAETNVVAVSQQPPVAQPGQPAAATPTPPTGQNYVTIITAQSKFLVKPAFREVLDLVPGVAKEQFVFTYEEVSMACCFKSVQESIRFLLCFFVNFFLHL